VYYIVIGDLYSASLENSSKMLQNPIAQKLWSKAWSLTGCNIHRVSMKTAQTISVITSSNSNKF